MSGSAGVARGRDLFFQYDGSRFYMSRDGVEAEYNALGVPREVERGWLREITSERLDDLHEPGNWRTVHFLWHHSDFAHVDAVLEAEPRGRLWEQCAFLEEVLLYVKSAAEAGEAEKAEVERAAARVESSARSLTGRARSESSRERVQAIANEARLLSASRDIRRP